MGTSPPPRSVFRASFAHAASLGLLVCVSAALAFAEDGVEPVRLSFESSPECPNQATFEGQVRARTERYARASEGQVARAFRVTVSAAAERFQGHLVIEDPAGESSERFLEGKSCEELVSALALVTALAIDPEAKTAAVVEPVPIPEPSASAPIVQPPPPPSATTPPPLPVRVPPPAPAPRPAPARPWAFAGVGAVVVVGTLPSPQLAPSLFLEARLADELGVDGRLRFSLVHAESGVVQAGTGYALFTWTAGVIDSCWVPLQVEGVLLYPCAGVEVGILHGEGQALQTGTSRGRTWAAFDGGFRAAYDLSRDVSLDFSGALSLPLVRDTFAFDPDTDVFQTSALGGRVVLGASLGWE